MNLIKSINYMRALFVLYVIESMHCVGQFGREACAELVVFEDHDERYAKSYPGYDEQVRVIVLSERDSSSHLAE
jgi:hypothetical protein